MKRFFILMMAALLLVALAGCGGSKADPEPTPTPEPDVSKVSIEDCIHLIESNMKDSFGDKYKVDLNAEDHVVKFFLWAYDIAEDTTKAVNGDEEMISAWNEMLEGVLDLSESIQTLVDENCDEAYKTMLILLNEQNRDNALLITSGSTVIYDVVNGVNLLED